MAVVTTPTRQWRITASQLQIAGGITDPAGTFRRRYLTANLTQTVRIALIVESTTTLVGLNGATYDRVDKKVVTFDEGDVYAFLNQAGETLPPVANRVMNYTPAGSRGNVEDEVVVTDNSVAGSL